MPLALGTPTTAVAAIADAGPSLIAAAQASGGGAASASGPREAQMTDHKVTRRRPADVHDKGMQDDVGHIYNDMVYK